MARRARGFVHAGIYHVTRRSAGPIDMFRDDVDRTAFCNHLERSVDRHGWICHAFCLMTTHYHLLVEVADDALQPGMRDLNGPYAQGFNRRWGRRGHLKGGPYGAVEVTTDVHFLETVRYIARNPVRARLCDHPAEWAWSTYRGCGGYEPGFPFVTAGFTLSCFHEDREEAIRRLRVFVEG